MEKVIHGDCLEELKKLQEGSVDCVVTDPPYGYSFMGKDWDRAVPSVEIWRECLRVLKPGAFAFVMSAPRQDVLSQMIVRLGEAGFDTSFTSLYWTYASGFPKALSISKAIDRRAGVEREVIGTKLGQPGYSLAESKGHLYGGGFGGDGDPAREAEISAPATPEAQALDGSYGGFQPKPAVEVIIVAMKPLSEKTYVDQALKNRKGVTWLMPDCGIPSAAPDSDASAPESCQDGEGGISFDVLLKAAALLRDAPCTTQSCSKNCKDLGHHAFDGGCNAGIELSQWAASVQSGISRPPSNEGAYGRVGPSVPSSQSDCPACRRCDDVQPRPSEVDGQVPSPSQHDALAHIVRLVTEHSDTQQNKCTALLATANDFLRVVHSYTTQSTGNGRRWPANLLVSDDVLNDGKESKSTDRSKYTKSYGHENGSTYMAEKPLGLTHADSGSYSRFFSLDAWAANLPEHVRKVFPFLIVPKASKREKNEGLEGFEEKLPPPAEFRPNHTEKALEGDDGLPYGRWTKVKNTHATVKPLTLMSYLITLGSRPGDTILDPFLGSGTTACAAKALGRGYIGIEREAEYVRIAEARIAAVETKLL